MASDPCHERWLGEFSHTLNVHFTFSQKQMVLSNYICSDVWLRCSVQSLLFNWFLSHRSFVCSIVFPRYLFFLFSVMCPCLWRRLEASVACRITGSCEPPNMGTGNWTLIPCENNTCSQPLSHPAPHFISQGIPFLSNAWILGEMLIAHQM